MLSKGDLTVAGVLSKNRELWMSYLAVIGCKKSTIWQITMIDLESELAILDMLLFCKENHPNFTEEMILEQAYKISLNYERDAEEEN